jgi:predicted nucleic-acid-binding Zn-ribbon protein
MKNGICPKCNSSEVYHSFSESSLGAGLRADDGILMVNLHKESKSLFGDDFTLLPVGSYLCRSCGYVESYVQDMARLSQKLDEATNWKKVNH